MPANYVLISEQTVSVPVTSVTFSNIPQTGYTDLKIVISARISATSNPDFSEMSVNGSLANFTSIRIQGNGSSVATSSFSNSYSVIETNNFTTNTFGSTEIYCPNYTSSNPKSFSVQAVTENNATTSYIEAWTWLWNQTASITSLGFPRTGGQTYLAGTTFSLYGIAALGTTPTVLPKAAGGDIVVNDGTYWYHAFLASGTFTPSSNLSCDYLVIAGGGGGGGQLGGGGGAGGLRSTVTATGGGGSVESPLSLVAENYAVTVGAGGAAGSSASGTTAPNGSNSIFSTVTSTGGGGGAGAVGGTLTAGASGGSGGGGAGGTSAAGGARTVNQGFAGGLAGGVWGVGEVSGGGGGGAGVVGQSCTQANSVNVGGNGGNGVSLSAWATPTSTGVSAFYAGGGGGAGSGTEGTGGSGGGGAGGRTGSSPNAVAGTVNTGSGGGGGSNSYSGSPAAGGSGIVIVRYTMA